jgi:sarcosine oxidase subunit alpha
MLGHVTSAYFSATLGRSIALAMVSAGRARMNTDVFVPMPDCIVRARVVAPVFHDPEGACQHG